MAKELILIVDDDDKDRWLTERAFSAPPPGPAGVEDVGPESTAR